MASNSKPDSNPDSRAKSRRVILSQISGSLTRIGNGLVSRCPFLPIRSGRNYLIGLAPALVAIVVTALTELAPLSSGADSFLLWNPFEVSIWFVLVVIGVMWANHKEVRLIRHRLNEVNKAEEDRRAIAAIGMAASWDLDLSRLYQRVSQDLRSILEFDRFTITSALPTGRMRIEFVSGDSVEGYPAGSILPAAPDEPDGLYAKYRSNYRSRLTAAIPACNGTLTIRNNLEGQYNPAQLDLLRQAVAQISPGIANAIIFQSSERRLRERTVLADIGRAATSASDAQVIIKTVDTSLKTLINYDHLGVILVDEKDEARKTGLLTYWSQAGLSGWNEGDSVPLNDMGAGQGTVVVGYGDNFTFDPITEEPKESGTRAWLHVPLLAHEEMIGILVLSSTEQDAFGQEDLALLLNVSLQIAPAIENVNLTATLKRRADERRTIAAIGLSANSNLNLESIYNGMAEELAKVLEFDRMSITLLSSESGENQVAFSNGVTLEGFETGDVIKVPLLETSFSAANEREWVSNSPTMKPLIEGTGLKSRASAPLGTASNALGRVNIASLRENTYTPQDIDLLERIALQVAPAIRNATMIAAERELRETLDRQNQELAEANNARKQFLSTVSHELKTPLTIISGFIDLLASPNDLQDQKERQETFGIIRRNADHLNVLINDILDISRMDAGTFKINPLPFSAGELISDLEASFQSLLRTKTQTLAVDMDEDEVWVNADRSRISQVITNLLSNASKYSPENTRISLGGHVDGERLHISVTDQGRGMTEEEQVGLFTAFFRADNEVTRENAGTGLGLVIAKSITELHGGEIKLTSSLGEGTTIEFWLPGLTTKEAAEVEAYEESEIFGSRLWPDGPPEDIELGAD